MNDRTYELRFNRGVNERPRCLRYARAFEKEFGADMSDADADDDDDDGGGGGGEKTADKARRSRREGARDDDDDVTADEWLVTGGDGDASWAERWVGVLQVLSARLTHGLKGAHGFK